MYLFWVLIVVLAGIMLATIVASIWLHEPHQEKERTKLTEEERERVIDMCKTPAGRELLEEWIKEMEEEQHET